MSVTAGALRASPGGFLRRVAAVAAAALIALPSLIATPAAAQTRKPAPGPPIVRDAETEALLRDYLRPIFKAAQLPGGSPEVVLINSDDFNAFVVDSRRIFINTGVLTASETPNEVIGVLAHETGHIAGGHLARMRETLARAQLIAALGMILGAGAAAAGAVSGLPGVSTGGMAVITGGNQVAMRSLLAYQRSEEEAADRAGLKFLQRTKQSPKGMLAVFGRLANEQLIAARRADPYVMSHPMARDRLVALEAQAKASPYFDVKDPPALQARHDMVRAKIAAFTQNPATVARRYPPTDTSAPARYARAVLYHRQANWQGSIRELDLLIAAQPSNPYLYELKGQVLLESGRARESVAPLRKAVALAPGAGLIRVLLGQALVASGDPALNDEAIEILARGVRDEPNAGIAYRYLASAYAQRGDTALADLAAARGALSDGDVDTARRYAARAQSKLKTGSPEWVQADDIVTYDPKRPKQP